MYHWDPSPDVSNLGWQFIDERECVETATIRIKLRVLIDVLRVGIRKARSLTPLFLVKYLHDIPTLSQFPYHCCQQFRRRVLSELSRQECYKRLKDLFMWCDHFKSSFEKISWCVDTRAGGHGRRPECRKKVPIRASMRISAWTDLAVSFTPLIQEAHQQNSQRSMCRNWFR